MTVAEINRKLDLARTHGPLQDIIVPPCPELLTALQREVSQPDPDPAVIARIAGSDVAMAAALIRIANSSYYARSRAVRTVNEVVAMFGVKPTVSRRNSGVLRHTSAEPTSEGVFPEWRDGRAMVLRGRTTSVRQIADRSPRPLRGMQEAYREGAT